MTSASLSRALLLVLALLTGACTSTQRTSSDSWTRDVHRSTSAPDWYGEPLSWRKLQRIETWLAGSGPREWPNSVPEAELELASGRLELARRDANSLTNTVLRTRLDLAEAGFHRVLASASTGTFQREQAERGLRDVATLRGAGLTVSKGLSTGIQPRATWGASPARSSRLKPNRRPWTRITVHHSDTEATDTSAIQRIQRDHMQTQGWGDIGYHFLIDPSGRVFQGRRLEWQGAHAGGKGGKNNVGNIGICLLGDFESERPSARALAALEGLVDALRGRHGIPRSAVKGHSAYKATACPGRHLLEWVRRYAG